MSTLAVEHRRPLTAPKPHKMAALAVEHRPLTAHKPRKIAACSAKMQEIGPRSAHLRGSCSDIAPAARAVVAARGGGHENEGGDAARGSAYENEGGDAARGSGHENEGGEAVWGGGHENEGSDEVWGGGHENEGGEAVCSRGLITTTSGKLWFSATRFQRFPGNRHDLALAQRQTEAGKDTGRAGEDNAWGWRALTGSALASGAPALASGAPAQRVLAEAGVRG